MLGAALLVAVALVGVTPGPATAQTPVESARALLKGYQEDPARIDRARDLLEAAVAREARDDVPTLLALARAWYLYGASGEAYREYMPNHALQWQAIRWAKSLGCREYDLWGIPDADEATLEAQYLSRNDDLWGVYRFKRGFGGQVLRFAGAFDRVYNSLLYRVYLLVTKYRGNAE